MIFLQFFFHFFHYVVFTPCGLSSGDLSPGGLSSGDLSPGGLSSGDLSSGGLSSGDLSSGGLSLGLQRLQFHVAPAMPAL